MSTNINKRLEQMAKNIKKQNEKERKAEGRAAKAAAHHHHKESGPAKSKMTKEEFQKQKE